MSRWVDAEEEEWDDDPDSDEGDDGDDTIPCPYCRRDIHEDAQRCPYCSSYISRKDSPPVRKPWWIILGAVACLYVVYRWIVPF